MTPRRRVALPFLLALACLLAACGGASDGRGATATATTEASATAAPDASGEPVASTAAVPTESLPVARFTMPDGTEARLPVEVIGAAEFAVGLSGRTSLEGRGMLFYWPDGNSQSGFWMKGTHIPLDIAFVDRDREVIAILQMEAESLEIHRPDAPYLAAVEAPLGWYAAHGIEAGARVTWEFDPDALGAGR
ncbi:MAG: hypothetical protein AMXMBFR23_06370 [Chloroflexota bacterium]